MREARRELRTNREAMRRTLHDLRTNREAMRRTLHDLRVNLGEMRRAAGNLRKLHENRADTKPLQNPGASAPVRITPAPVNVTAEGIGLHTGVVEVEEFIDLDIDSPITIDQAAAYAQCGRRRIEYAMNHGELEYMGAKGMRRTTRRWILDWLKKLRENDQ